MAHLLAMTFDTYIVRHQQTREWVVSRIDPCFLTEVRGFAKVNTTQDRATIRFGR